MNDREIILEQYKVYIDNLNNVSTKAGGIHPLYFSLIGAAFAIISLAESGKIFNSLAVFVLMIAAILGIFICMIWFQVIRFYGTLFDRIFANLREMEKSLPTHPYTDESKDIETDKNNFSNNNILNKIIVWVLKYQSKNKNQEQRTLRKIEAFIPIVFGIVFVILLGTGIYQYSHPSRPVEQKQCPICQHMKK